MSLLSLAKDVADMLAIKRPLAAYGDTSDDMRRLIAYANVEGRSLAKLNWPVLRAEKTFASTATEIQTNAMATDWGRFCDETFWNRTAVRRLDGPIDPVRWQEIKARSGGGTDFFTYRGGNILITPVPTAAQTMAYEYYSKNWCQTGSTGKAAWSADADTGLLDEALMALGIVWRFKKASSMAWEGDYAIYESEVRTALGQSGPAATFDMASDGGVGGWRSPGLYVPDTIP